ncbi:uncharacterized protein LOC110810881 [Carica papaya]|uniref:uncharacterized protein LOC110810881 n=1 Tax=Carica papaya TaxID=3649 RepID=UPI000B8CD910|nr:uncharacterized protein LOC110810881 [Carica papaya]
MVPKLEAVKGGGGSIRVGTTGTISSLMTRELESVKTVPQTAGSSQQKPGSVPASVAATPRRHRKSLDETSSCTGNCSSIEITRKMKSYTRNTHRIPMLGPDNIAFDRTPSREKSDKKGPNIVEIVDIKCGNPDRAWASPITSKLKKLGFSKLSESII